MTRTVLHLDLDAFFCAVEEQRDPSLRGKPFAVGGRPETRGVVASCSYPARKFGVHSAMPMSQAVRLCPDLLIVSHHFTDYHRASAQVMALLRATTPAVEQISIDEAFLDVSGLPETGEQIARRLQTRIQTELGLPCSFGVASNKLVAKIANNVGKDRAGKGSLPNALVVVPSGEEAAFLAPLPVRELWGVGPKTAERLAELNVHTIGDLAALPESHLRRMFGKHGVDIGRGARGLDDRPVVTEHETKSISNEVTFARDVTDADELRKTLRTLSERVGYRLRQEGLSGTTVKIKLRWSDFTTLTRQLTRSQPIDQDDAIIQNALRLFEQTWSRGKAVRLLGVGVSGLRESGVQLSLWDAPTTQQSRALQAALDDVHERFGADAIQRGSALTDANWDDD